MTPKPGCLYLSEVIPPRADQPMVLAALEPGHTKGEFAVIPIAGSSTTGATLACEEVSGINSQCRRDVGLLTLYSLSWPWMVSRCTRVQVRATAVLFKTRILTSVGAALGSEQSGIKQNVR